MAKVKINKTDKMFSDWVRNRDDWTCQRCGAYKDPSDSRQRMGLHCSHYWKRGKHATRFDTDNCISLCMGCHLRLEGDKQGEYKDLMIKRLGQAKFDRLETLSKTTLKKRIAEEEALLWLR